MSKSIEPVVTDWANSQLTNDGLKIAREQGTIDIRIDEALSKEPSKHGGDGHGRPDTQLMISNGAVNIPVVIEYKGLKGKLEFTPKKSDLIKLKNDDNTYDYKKAIPQYAVNGAAYYASVILRHTDFSEILCIGVNGYNDTNTNDVIYEVKAYITNKQNPDLPIYIGSYSDLSFLFKKNQSQFIEKIEDAQIDPEELHKKALLDDARLDEVLKKLNNHLRNESRIRTGQRIFVVAACIMAGLGVKDKEGNYVVTPLKSAELTGSQETDNTDGDKINRKIKAFLAEKSLPVKKQEQIDNALRQVIIFGNLSRKDSETNITPLKSAYILIESELIPAYKMAGTLDFTGKLFNVMNEWVDVPDGDANDVVLTPRYVTNLMARLCEVDMNSYVWDWALGSGGFLISAMNIMIADARKRIHSSKELENAIFNIKNKQLLGIEKLPDIYILAILNMILMGDGSSNIALEDSLKDFDGDYIYNDSGTFPANVFLLNPPYSAEGNGMIFVEKALSKMNGGKAAVIIQDSAGNGKATEINKRILKNNRLLASITMPEDLFKSNVHTVIYVFEVGKPHSQNNIVKFFNFENDGYKRNYRKKAKHTLIDTGTAKERYDDLVNSVINSVASSPYLNNDKHYVEDTINPLNGNDWNFSKHRKSDTVPVKDDYVEVFKDYAIWSLKEQMKNTVISFDLNKSDWQSFKAEELFSIETTRGINKDSLTPPSDEYTYDYVTRTADNRGILQQTGLAQFKNGKEVKLNPKNTFSLGLLQMTFFYREREWYSGQFVRKITPLFNMDKSLALFFETLLNKQSEKLSAEIVSDVDKAFYSLDLLLPADIDGTPDFNRIRTISDELTQDINKTVFNLLN